MKLTHFGHACVLVERAGHRALIDPGTYSHGFEQLSDLDLILITHAHPDHVDAERLATLRELNPHAVLVTNPQAGEALHHPGDVLIIGDGSPVEAGGFLVQPTGSAHAHIHPDLPTMANTGYVLDGTVWHPGDAFDGQTAAVDVLLLPVGGPFMKISEAIDFARAAKPRVIVPIHQAGLAEIHRQLHYQLLRNLVEADVIILPEGEAQEF